jgi:hypothetical protein
MWLCVDRQFGRSCQRALSDLTEDDFTKAISYCAQQNAQQHGTELTCTTSHEPQETAEISISLDNQGDSEYPRQDSNLGPAV